MRAAILAVLVGCSSTHTIGMFVHSVTIANGELLVERCILEQTANVVTAKACTTDHHALPAAPPPP
ncbi:MAG: hypothetical protein ABI867_45655 [Kofleriaceae bacterium]